MTSKCIPFQHFTLHYTLLSYCMVLIIQAFRSTAYEMFVCFLPRFPPPTLKTVSSKNQFPSSEDV